LRGGGHKVIQLSCIKQVSRQRKIMRNHPKEGGLIRKGEGNLCKKEWGRSGIFRSTFIWKGGHENRTSVGVWIRRK